jgi:putative Holliday junction resolvase
LSAIRKTSIISPTDATSLAKNFASKLQNDYPQIPIHWIDERFTSKIATQSLREMGLKKKDRQNKSLVDQVSAVLILQTFLERKNLFKN